MPAAVAARLVTGGSMCARLSKGSQSKTRLRRSGRRFTAQRRRARDRRKKKKYRSRARKDFQLMAVTQGGQARSASADPTLFGAVLTQPVPESACLCRPESRYGRSPPAAAKGSAKRCATAQKRTRHYIGGDSGWFRKRGMVLLSGWLLSPQDRDEAGRATEAPVIQMPRMCSDSIEGG